jgi:hypothetical protein
VGRYWFAQVSPLDYFAVTGSTGGRRLEFEDLELAHGWADPRATTYWCRLAYCGCSGGGDVIEERVFAADQVADGLPLEPDFARAAAARLDEGLPGVDCTRRFYLELRVGRTPGGEDWEKWVRVYMDYLEGAGFALYGVDREE